MQQVTLAWTSYKAAGRPLLTLSPEITVTGHIFNPKILDHVGNRSHRDRRDIHWTKSRPVSRCLSQYHLVLPVFYLRATSSLHPERGT